MTTRVPPDRLGVPFAEFTAMIDEAVRRYHADQNNRYLGGVLAALTWIAGMREEDPITRQPRPADRATQLEISVAADALSLGLQDPVFGLTGIAPEWARGVAVTITWVRASGGPQPPPLNVAPFVARNAGE